MIGPFLAELRNRKVARVALIYCAAAFAVLEFSEIAFPRLGLPDYAVDVVLRLVLIGLPIAMLLAWFFDASRTPSGGNEKISWVSLPTIAVATALLVIGIVAGTFLSIGNGEPSEQTRVPVVHGVKIAVLPFDNISGDEERGYFSDGLIEDISTALSRFSDLQVIPSQLTYSYRNATDLVQAGKELGTAYVIAGSVRLQPSSVRINVQLIDVSAGTELWSESYDRALTAANLFDVQTDVARRVVGTIADSTGVLARVGQRKLRTRPTEELEAYDCVLRSYAYLTIHDDETHRLARSCLERAVELDPAYVDAWAHLGYLYREEYHHYRNQQPDALLRALKTIQHAIDLDASNAMARFAMSMTQFSLGDLPTAKAHAERAMELNPNDATFLAGFAIYFSYAGEVDRGVELARQAQALNPLSPSWLFMAYATSHYLKGEYEECLNALSNWTQGVDTQWHYHRVAALGQLDRKAEAKAALEDLLAFDAVFAEDPEGQLLRYTLTVDTTRSFLDGLIKAGLKLPDNSAR